MNFGELKTQINTMLIRPDLTSSIPTFVNIAQNKLEKTNWRRMLYRNTGVVSSGDTIAIPSNYKETVWLYLLSGGIKYKLNKLTFEELFNKYNSDTQSQPYDYTTNWGNDTFILRPYPDTIYTFDFMYYKYTPMLINDTDTNWWTDHAWETLMYGALVVAQRVSGEENVSWKDLYMESVRELLEEENNEQMAGTHMIIGAPSTPYFNIENC